MTGISAGRHIKGRGITRRTMYVLKMQLGWPKTGMVMTASGPSLQDTRSWN